MADLYSLKETCPWQPSSNDTTAGRRPKGSKAHRSTSSTWCRAPRMTPRFVRWWRPRFQPCMRDWCSRPITSRIKAAVFGRYRHGTARRNRRTPATPPSRLTPAAEPRTSRSRSRRLVATHRRAERHRTSKEPSESRPTVSREPISRSPSITSPKRTTSRSHW